MKIFLSEESVLRHSKRNRPLPSVKTLTFKMRTSAQPLLWKWVWFGTEARGNSQMVFCFASYPDRYLKRQLPRPQCMSGGMLREIAEPLNHPEKMDKLRSWSKKKKNDFPSNCRINTYLINLVWLICLKGRNRAYRTGWTNLQRALWWTNAWRTHGMNLLSLHRKVIRTSHHSLFHFEHNK